ncbi:MAG: DUF4394 domain-containing protein, partial [Verrucomicrobiaceae bacterium]
AYDTADMHAGEAPAIVAVAYTNSIGKPEATAMYDIDATIVALIQQAPPNDGILKAVGKLGVEGGSSYGFDISATEDLTNTEYLRDCAMQAGLETKLVFIDDIGWDGRQFLDLEEAPIRNIFKLYPWEWLLGDSFGENILQDSNRAFWIEPAWKMILSNKAILAVLWELYPDHPLLLPSYFDQRGMTDFVKKPILGREGANVHIVRNGALEQFVEGGYGKEGYVYQQLFELPHFDGNYPVIGSWIIGQEPAGMGIREANGLVTDNRSRFVPHLIEM